MPVMNFSLDSDGDLDEQLAEITKLLNYLLNGHLDSLNIRQLTADKITVGTLLANLVTIMAANGSKFFKFDEDGIVANNGSEATLKFDLATGLLTIVSALIQSATGYPRVELNSASTLISAIQDANNRLDIAPTFGGSPAAVFTAAGTPGVASFGTSAAITTLFSAVQMLIQSTGNLNLSTGGNLTINGGTGQTGTVYVSATSGGPANIPISFTKGIRTT